MIRKFIFIPIAVLLLLTSCNSKKDYSSLEYAGQSSLKLKSLKNEEKLFIQDKNICIILGYGYEKQEARASIEAKLEQNFGIETEEKSGLILLYYFPDDFKKYGPARISQLTEYVQDKNLAGIIIYGAPDGMNIPLARLQDKQAEEETFYPVFNFFPQDDILGSESTSTFVVDYAVQMTETTEESTSEIPNFNSDTLIINAINKLISSKGVVPMLGNELKNYVSAIIEQDKVLKFYHDAETGLKSINHFIFE